MKIKKVSQPVAAVGQILNEKSNSTKDTYSCDYINKFDNQLNRDSSYNGVDANDFDVTGFYYLASNCTNVPTSYVKLIVCGASPTDVVQIAISVGNQTLYIRSRNGSNWSVWKTIG